MTIKNDTNKKIALVVSSASIGGILATACGFSFPTLFFLDPELFNSWLVQPVYFVTVMAGLAFTAGWFGVWVANVIEERLIVQENYEFPIGQVIYKMIEAQQQARKSLELAIGFVGAMLFSFFKSGLAYLKYTCHIPRFLVLVPRMRFGVLHIPLTQVDFAIFPMLLAIGFIAGHLITVPLFVGAFAKIFVTGPLNIWFFSWISSVEFLLAFCSGMVIAGAVVGFIKTPKMFLKKVKKFLDKKNNQNDINVCNDVGMCSSMLFSGLTKECALELILLLAVCVVFLTYFDFSLLTQLYLLFLRLCARIKLRLLRVK